MNGKLDAIMTIRISDADRVMLAELSEDMRISESAVIRLLIAREYRQTIIGGGTRGTE